MPRNSIRESAFATLILAGMAWQTGMVPAHAQTDDTADRPALLSGDEPIEIVSDRLEVHEKDNTAVFTGNVSLVQDKFLLRTMRMVVHYVNTGKGSGSLSGNSTQVKRIEAEGKVYIKSNEQVATGDQGTYEMASSEMVLTGKEVVMTEGDNVVVGCKLTMNTKSGESQVDGCEKDEGGRVRMLLQPEPADN